MTTTLILYVFALPFLGVIFAETLHVPTFIVFTEVPLALQIFFDDEETVIFIFEDDAMVIFALVARQERVIVFPFATLQETCATFEFVGAVVVGGATGMHEIEPRTVVVVPVGQTDAVVAPA